MLSGLLATLLGYFDSEESLFREWKATHFLQFSPAEDAFRKTQFLENLAMIRHHNADPDRTFSLGLNQFSAYSFDQFSSLYLNKVQGQSAPSGPMWDPDFAPGADINWNAAGYVTGVKAQYGCSSGYAFGTTGAMQFLYKKKTGQLTGLSEQQIVDCDKRDFNCSGGYVNSALNYTAQVGLATGATYPYTATAGVCKSFTPVIRNAGVGLVTNCTQLYNVLQNSTVAVMVEANGYFQQYSSGVFSNCGTTVNHGLLLVGVATNSYWYVKNEWATTWGEYGYIRLAWGNTCGICQQGAYPV